MGHPGDLLKPGIGTESDLEREFGARFSETSTFAFQVAVGVLRHREDAEDVAQEALTRAYFRFSRLREPDRFRPWLARITWRLAINRRRSDQRRAARETVKHEMQETQTAMETLVASERSKLLWQSIEVLPEKLRVVIVLQSIHEHAIQEIAGQLRVPTGTVKKRLFLARQRLRELLK